MAKQFKMRNGYFELNSDGVAELLRSEGMQGILTEYGDAALNRADPGKGYEGELKVYKRRAAYNIKAETKEAKRDNSKHNTLLKALGGGK